MNVRAQTMADKSTNALTNNLAEGREQRTVATASSSPATPGRSRALVDVIVPLLAASVDELVVAAIVRLVAVANLASVPLVSLPPMDTVDVSAILLECRWAELVRSPRLPAARSCSQSVHRVVSSILRPSFLPAPCCNTCLVFGWLFDENTTRVASVSCSSQGTSALQNCMHRFAAPEVCTSTHTLTVRPPYAQTAPSTV